DMISAADPDIIVLQEYADDQRQALHPLIAGAYPFAANCVGVRRGNIAIYARLAFSFRDGEACSWDSERRSVRIVARFEPEDESAFTVVTTHLDWPIQISVARTAGDVLDAAAQMPARQRNQFAELTAALSEVRGPLIVAADFNATSWSFAMRNFAIKNR